MKKYFLFIGVALFIGVFVSSIGIAQQSTEDVVYLKNGSIIRGMVIEQVPGVSIKIEARDGNIFVYKTKEVAKIVKEPTKENPKKEIEKSETEAEKKKSPVAAGCLSAVIPGVGQIYNGDTWKGIACLGVSMTGSLMSSEEDLQIPGAIIFLGVWVYSIADAVITAKKINTGKKVGLEFKPEKDNVSLALSYKF